MQVTVELDQIRSEVQLPVSKGWEGNNPKKTDKVTVKAIQSIDYSIAGWSST